MLASCSRTGIPLPDPPNAKSVVLLTEGIELAHANDLVDAPGIAVDIPQDASAIFALFYDVPLEDLELKPGTLARAIGGEKSRALPQPFFTYRAAFDDGTAGDWEASSVAESLTYERFRLPYPSLEGCHQRGGCISADAARCTRPCPGLDTSIPPPDRGPIAPRFEPCPEGWVTEYLGAIAYCEPYPAQPTPCPNGQAWLPGRPGCEPLGTPCPMGQYPENLPGNAAIIYARAGAAAGGTGTPASPFRSITDALAALPEGGIVALGAGVYAEDVNLTKTATLAGACAERTRIEGTLSIATPNAALRGTTVSSSGDTLTVAAGTTLDLNGTAIESTAESAVLLGTGARLRAAAISIRAAETAVRSAESTHVTINRAALFAKHPVLAQQGTRMLIVDSRLEGFSDNEAGELILRRSTARSIDLGSPAISARNRAQLIIERSHFDCAPSDSICHPSIYADRAELTLEHTTFGGDAAHVYNGTETASITDVLIRHTASGAIGIGVADADLFAARVAIFGSPAAAIHLMGPELAPGLDLDRRVSFEDLTILGANAYGIHVDTGISLRVTHASIDGTAGVAVNIAGTTSNLETTAFFEDVTIADAGVGVQIHGVRRVDFNRVRIAGIDQSGLDSGYVTDTPRVTASFLEITDTCLNIVNAACSAINVKSGSFSVQGFRVANSALGIAMNEFVTFDKIPAYETGLITGVDVGFRAATGDPYAMFRDVAFPGVPALCDLCGDVD